MFDTLKEKLGKILCFFGFHDYEKYYKEGYITLFRCTRPECAYHSTELKIPDPPQMPHCEEPWDRAWENDLKMYILIREDTPANLVPLIAAHTAMGTYREFEPWIVTQKWFETELQKTVICKVSAKQFEKAKEYGDWFALIEVHHQELGELGLGFRVQKEYPKFFKFLPLYKVA